MVGQPLSACARACSDTNATIKGVKFWAFDAVGGVIASTSALLVLLKWGPSNIWIRAGVPPAVLITWLLAGVLCILVWHLFWAPYRQRDEARNALQANAASSAPTLDAQLREFIKEGEELKRRCTITSEPPPDALAENWARRVSTFLSDNFGGYYVDRWQVRGGKPKRGFTGMITPAGHELWNIISVRIDRLEELEKQVRT